MVISICILILHLNIMWSEGKIEKVPRDVRIAKSGKTTTISEKSIGLNK